MWWSSYQNFESKDTIEIVLWKLKVWLQLVFLTIWTKMTRNQILNNNFTLIQSVPVIKKKLHLIRWVWFWPCLFNIFQKMSCLRCGQEEPKTIQSHFFYQTLNIYTLRKQSGNRCPCWRYGRPCGTWGCCTCSWPGRRDACGRSNRSFPRDASGTWLGSAWSKPCSWQPSRKAENKKTLWGLVVLNKDGKGTKKQCDNRTLTLEHRQVWQKVEGVGLIKRSYDR